MPGTLSSSPQKDLFIEYLSIAGRSDRATTFISAIDRLCVAIATQKFMGATEDDSFDMLNKIAIGLQSSENFSLFIIGTFQNHYKKYKNSTDLITAYKVFFEFIDTQTTEKSFAKYIVGRYRLGYRYLARYWAAVLFERIIERKTRLYEKKAWDALKNEKKQDPTLDDNIYLLSLGSLSLDSIYKHVDVFSRYHDKNFNVYPMSADDLSERINQTRERLLNFKKLRNDTMHYINQKERMADNSLELVYYVWSELLPEDFFTYKEKANKLGIKIIDAISELAADYMVRAIDETRKENADLVTFDRIHQLDFENLFLMREKLLSLQSKFKKWKLLSKVGLATDIVTTIDTTSAYIWMPLVPYNSQITLQQGIYNCAVSILVTPLDFRVYMDFGGYAVDEREAYYRFLGSPEYRTFMEPFEKKGEIEIFDIDWFCFIAERAHLGVLSDIVNPERIDLAEQKLAKYGSTPPITWNRMLHGYILKRENVPKEGITLEWVKKRLEWVIQFYQEFNTFCDNNKKDK